MNATTRLALAGLLGAALLCGAPRGLRADKPAASETPRSKNAWTLDEALHALKLSPRDTYLQYVVLQLARREGKLEQVAGEVEKLAFGGDTDGRAERRAQVDLFGTFTGALAVQEGLQLDTMRGRTQAAEQAPTGPVCKVVGCWQSRLVETHDAANGGAPLRGLAGQVYLFGPDLPEGGVGPPVSGDGELTVELYQERPMAAGGEPVALERWQFPPESLKLQLRKHPWGWGYSLFLPWGKSYRPDITHVRLRVCYTPPGAAPLHSLSTMIDLAAPDPKAADADSRPCSATECPLEHMLVVLECIPAPSASGEPDKENQPVPAAPMISPTLAKMRYQITPETGYEEFHETGIGKDGWPEQRIWKVLYAVGRISVLVDGDALAPVSDQGSTKAPASDPFSETIKQVTEAAKWEKIAGPSVRVSQLHGPTVKSHPWRKMLAGRDPEVSRLSRCVPHDFYLVEFRSVGKLLEVLDSADHWSTFIYSQSVKDARSQRVAERLQKQLALEVGALPRPFYDLVLDGIAITGSDLFVREGSDVTLLLPYRREKVFKQGMEDMLAKAAKSRPDATRTTGKMLGVDYVHLETPDRSVCVYAAYPEPGLHIRTNSEVALRRVLEAIRGKDARGKPVKRLGETDEFKYIRTLMPHGAKEEDGFVYLSDAFIRHMVSPQLKLTELRRLTAYNHLRMIGHASQLYRTEQGKAPASLEALAEADCCPGKFNEGALKSPDGGTYALSADGSGGVCARHGTVRFLTPCCEIPVGCVTWDEAAAYKAFVEQYSEYWRTYFDPIAIRVQVQPKRIRMETVVLPLIDNTVYTMLSKVLGGEPEHLDSLPVPKRNLFSMTVRPNWEGLLKEVVGDEAGKVHKVLALVNGEPTAVGPVAVEMVAAASQRPMAILPAICLCAELENEVAEVKKSPLAELGVSAMRLVNGGLGNQVGLHVYDQGVPFDLNLATFLGQMLGSFNGSATGTGGSGGGLELMAIAVPVAACTAPGYISLTVQDERIVDDFLAQLDKAIPSLASEFKGDIGFPIEGDYYKLTLKGGLTARSFAVRLGPARFRVHCARIGKGLYITNHASVLEDIQAAAKTQAKLGAAADLGPKGHAMVRMRPRNWDQALPGFRLSWAENNRQTCLCNQGPLSGIARALTAVPPGAEAGKTASWDDRRIHDYAARVYGTHYACPDGGRYVLSADGKAVRCTVHGSPQDPRQGAAPADDSPTARLMRDFADLTAALTFTPEGLRAVLTIERK